MESVFEINKKRLKNSAMTAKNLLADVDVEYLFCKENLPQRMKHQQCHRDCYSHIHQKTVVGVGHHSRRHQGRYQLRTHTPVAVYNYCHRQQTIHIRMDWIETLVDHMVPLTTLLFTFIG
jgi:hypothetical protein